MRAFPAALALAALFVTTSATNKAFAADKPTDDPMLRAMQLELDREKAQLLLPGKPVRGGGRAVSTTPGQSAISIELDRLRALDPALRRRVLRAAARQLGARLSFDETSRLLALCGFRPYPPVGAPTVAAHG